MCLGIPGRVLELLAGYGDQVAAVDVAGRARTVNIGMLADDGVAPGDWVIIHLGFAVEKTDEAGARQAMAGLELMGRPAAPELTGRPAAPELMGRPAAQKGINHVSGSTGPDREHRGS